MNTGAIGSAFNINYTPMMSRKVPIAAQQVPQQSWESGRQGYFRSIDGDSVELSTPRASIGRQLPVPNPVTATVMTGYGAYPYTLSPENMIKPNINIPQATLPNTAITQPPLPNTPMSPISTDISPKSLIPELPGSGFLDSLKPEGECQTCANRKYVDGSDDASVSYQTPTKISPNMAGAAVAAHEQEHVRNEQADAQRDGRQVVNQSVTLHYDSCPECGKSYVSGGTTRTTTVGRKESAILDTGNKEQNINTGTNTDTPE